VSSLKQTQLTECTFTALYYRMSQQVLEMDSFSSQACLTPGQHMWCEQEVHDVVCGNRSVVCTP
jgi:hypothetical protein